MYSSNFRFWSFESRLMINRKSVLKVGL